MNKLDGYIIFLITILSILLFIWIPSYPINNFDHILEVFTNRYLFGNGYYQPNPYPFAAKISNSFSTVIAIISALLISIWRINDKNNIKNEKPLKLLKISIFSFFMLAFFYGLVSAHRKFLKPQEGEIFSKASFQNNPFLFPIGLAFKNIILYIFTRFLGILVISLIKNDKTK